MTQTSTERAAWQIQASKLEQNAVARKCETLREPQAPPPKKKMVGKPYTLNLVVWLAAPSLTEDPGGKPSLKKKNYEFANLNPEP